MRAAVFFTFIVFLGSLSTFCQTEDDSPPLKGAYLGMRPPGLEPELFAPGVVSTDKTELGCSFSPDGNEVFFAEWNAGKNTLMTMKRKNGRWSKRAVASFSGDHSDVDPYFAIDGKRLYFSSSRPLEKGGDSKDSDIWYVDKTEDGTWGEPVHLGRPNTAGKDDYYTSIALNGTLYSSIFDSHGSPGNLYKSDWVDGQYTAPELLDSMNTSFSEHDPFVAPDESYLIFTSTRPGGFGREDLYISYKEMDGSWTEPKNMGKSINSSGFDFCPMLSPDGKYLFFTRNVNRNGDIYWVDSKIIEELRVRD